MRRGFTLVEIVVVLAVLGIAAAAVAPAFARLGEEDGVAAAANELAGALRAARRDAIERGRVVTVTVVPETGRYWVQDGGGAREDDADAVALPLPADVSLAAAGPRVRFAFSPLGDASGGPLVVRGRGGSAMITLDRWTGELRVERR